MNQVAGTILHAAPDKSIGKHLWEVTRVRTVMETISATLQEAEEITREAHIEQPEAKILTLNAAPLRDSKAELVGAVLVLHDVTELRRLENVRRDFVANVSHELKTPITTIKGFVETLQEGALEDRVQAERFLSIVARNADRLHAIIEDLLRLSRLDQHTEAADLPRIDTPLLHVLQTAVQTCATKAASRQISVTIACDEALVARVNPPLLEQALVNLLDNAINYSKAGDTIWLEAEHKDDAIVMHVRDEGIGIPQEHVNRLFERFYRVDRARGRDHGGTGLGLAIVKHIMQFHGGRVFVVSAVGQGSTFTLSLPVQDRQWNVRLDDPGPHTAAQLPG
jgi:two-component system phosphate regulon sensor histidine kinase PhoR